MQLVYSVDNTEMVEVAVPLNASEIQILYPRHWHNGSWFNRTELNSSRAHTLEVYLYNSIQFSERWSADAEGSLPAGSFELQGIELTGNASAPDGEREPRTLPFRMRKKRCVPLRVPAACLRCTARGRRTRLTALLPACSSTATASRRA